MQICFENICGKAHLSANQRRTAVSKQHSATAMFVVRFIADAPIFRLASSQTAKQPNSQHHNSKTERRKGKREDSKSARLAAIRPAFARPDTHLTSKTTTWTDQVHGRLPNNAHEVAEQNKTGENDARAHAKQLCRLLGAFMDAPKTAVGNSKMKANERPADRYAGRRLV